MKNKLCLILAILLLLSLAITGCTTKPEEKSDGKITVVTTIYPIYSWILELSKDISEIEVSYLTNKGQDMHSFNPSVSDIANISSCDLFVYIGGTSDAWVENTLKDATCETISLMYTEGMLKKYEEFKQGMEVEEDTGDYEWDEHIYLSLDNSVAGVTAISSSLKKIALEKGLDIEEKITANTTEYSRKAIILKENYSSKFAALEDKTLLFGDRFPFLYLTGEFDLGYFAPFNGCSSDSEASFETIAFLKQIAEAFSKKNIFIIEGSSTKTADTIMSDIEGYEVISLNSMQQVTQKDGESTSYLEIMEKNLELIYKSLEK